MVAIPEARACRGGRWRACAPHHGAWLVILLAVSGLAAPLARAEATGALWPGFNAPGFSFGVARGDITLLQYEGRLAAVGPFESLGRAAGFGAAVWDGAQWNALGAGIFGALFEGRVLGATVLGHDLIVARSSASIDDYYNGISTAVDFVRWDGSSWQRITTIPTIRYDEIRAVASYHGELIVGGTFDSVDGVAATNVAAWDGHGWHALGQGLDAAIRGTSNDAWNSSAIAVSSFFVLHDRLYAAGRFDGSGDRPMRNVAVWDGDAWQPLNRGLERAVAHLGEYRGELVASGGFRIVDGVPSQGLARWDGAHWRVFGNGAPRQWAITALASEGTLLCAATTDWDPVAETWRGALHTWDGVHWSAVVMPPRIQALLPFGGRLYAGGQFDAVDSVPVNGLASAALEDLAHWTPAAPGDGFSGYGWVDFYGYGTPVAALTTYRGDLIVAGTGLQRNAGLRGSVLRWSGDSWVTLGDFDAAVRSVGVVGDRLIAGGDFTHVGALAAAGVAAWDGTRWSAIGPGIADGGIEAVVPYNAGFVAVGHFNYIAGRLVHSIAAWDGTQWQRVGENNVIQGVTTAAVYHGHLLIGGTFNWDGRRTCRHIAAWDGVEWHEFQGGANEAVRSLVVDGDNLYIIGDFTQVGGVAARSGALWNGSAWQPLSVDSSATLAAIAPVGSELYAVSKSLRRLAFPYDAEVTSQLVAWNGSAWEARAARSPGLVTALQPVGSSIYIGGGFRFFGGQPAGSIARWDFTAAAVSRLAPAGAVVPTKNALTVAVVPGAHQSIVAFRIAAPGAVSLGVYDARGRLVQRLVSGLRAAGSYEAAWDQVDTGGNRVARGVYFVRLAAPDGVLVRKVVVMRSE